MVSQIITHLGSEAMQAILDGATLRCLPKGRRRRPCHDQRKPREGKGSTGCCWLRPSRNACHWLTAQKEDPKLEAVLQWLESEKKTDLRTLLWEYASSEEGKMVWRNHQNFTTLQDTLYLCSMPKEENEDLLLFVVLKMHQTAALNECHQDTRHQGHNCTLSLLHISGSPEWPDRWDKLFGPANAASSMKVAPPRHLYAL